MLYICPLSRAFIKVFYNIIPLQETPKFGEAFDENKIKAYHEVSIRKQISKQNYRTPGFNPGENQI